MLASTANEKLGRHSLKCTILSWLAKGSYASISDRRIAGHHMDPGSVSAITYSRDELTRIMAIEQKMVKDIRRKTFQPDQSRVQRLADLVATDSNLDDHPHIVEESDSGSDDLNERDLERDDLPNQVRMSFDDLTLRSLVQARIHCNSGACHLLLHDSKFRCGRKLTRNYDSITAGTTISDVPICRQCSRSFDEEASPLRNKRCLCSSMLTFLLSTFSKCFRSPESKKLNLGPRARAHAR